MSVNRRTVQSRRGHLHIGLRLWYPWKSGDNGTESDIEGFENNVEATKQCSKMYKSTFCRLKMVNNRFVLVLRCDSWRKYREISLKPLTGDTINWWNVPSMSYRVTSRFWCSSSDVNVSMSQQHFRDTTCHHFRLSSIHIHNSERQRVATLK